MVLKFLLYVFLTIFEYQNNKSSSQRLIRTQNNLSLQLLRHQIINNRQPQARTASAAGGGEKGFENFWANFVGDAAAVVEVVEADLLRAA